MSINFTCDHAAKAAIARLLSLSTFAPPAVIGVRVTKVVAAKKAHTLPLLMLASAAATAFDAGAKNFLVNSQSQQASAGAMTSEKRD